MDNDEQNLNEIELPVVIVRQDGGEAGLQTEVVSAKDICRPDWCDVSGGVHKKQAGYSIYGYLPYSDFKDKVKCNGRHDWGKNEMKVKVLPPARSGAIYRAGYSYLEEIVGPKPTKETNRGVSNRIKEILRENGNHMIRAELRKQVLEDFEAPSFQRAMWKLVKDECIILEPRYAGIYKQMVILVQE